MSANTWDTRAPPAIDSGPTPAICRTSVGTELSARIPLLIAENQVEGLVGSRGEKEEKGK
jgi:hypothetical protein